MFRPMFTDESFRIEHNPPRLSYGMAATDLDGDGRPEIVVTGFGMRTLVLDWQEDGRLRDIAPEEIADPGRRSIGVAAADANGDGQEEIYILNTDTYMGPKRFGDRFLMQLQPGDPTSWTDAFEFPSNLENPNLHAGRSVAALDPEGTGRYAFFVANYGGPLRMHSMDTDGRIRDRAAERGIDLVTGGRSLLILPDLGDYPAILCGNENDANALFVRDRDGSYRERAAEFDLADRDGQARGLALVDVDGDGLLDLVLGNWHSQARLFVRRRPGDPRSAFTDRAPAGFRDIRVPRNVVAADFDNDGAVEILFNMMGEPNRLFRVRGETLEELDPGAAAEPDGFGTGAIAADVDGDGVLELLISHGEQSEQPVSLFRARRAGERNFLRVAPLTRLGAPARGALVHLYADSNHQVRTVDGGSGYLCQMEPVAHFGLGHRQEVDAVEVIWPGGARRRLEQPGVNHELEVAP